LPVFFFSRIVTKAKYLSYNFPLGFTQVVNSSNLIDLLFMRLRAVHLDPGEQTRELSLPIERTTCADQPVMELGVIVFPLCRKGCDCRSAKNGRQGLRHRKTPSL
jgi:hypothetical protein